MKMTIRPTIASLLLAFLLQARPAAAADPAWTSVDSVIAVVNQDVVLQSEFDRRSTQLETVLAQVKDPAERTKRRMELRKQILRSLIDERIFVQAAVAMGITVVGPEIDRAIAEVKGQNKLDDAGLAKALAENGISMAQYREEIQRQILQAKLANLVIRPRIRISDEDLRAAYAEAKKRDPKRIGKFEEVRGPLQERMLEEAMMREQGRWVAERRAESFIDLKVEP
jgi:peptidyl-prolyl cis-trans isomerase SurA